MSALLESRLDAERKADADAWDSKAAAALTADARNELPAIFIAPRRAPASKWDRQGEIADRVNAEFDHLQRAFLNAVHTGPDATVPNCVARRNNPSASSCTVLEAFYEQIGPDEMRQILAILREVADGRGGDAAARIGAQAVIAGAAKDYADLNAEALVQLEGF